MEKRVLLAVGLSVAVLIGFNWFFSPIKRPTPAATSGSAAAPSATSPSTPAAAEVERETAPAAAPAAPAAQTLVGDTVDRPIVVENAAVRATFSTRGGVLTSWRLKHYARERRAAGARSRERAGRIDETLHAGHRRQGCERRARPGAVQAERRSLDATGAPATLTLEFSDASGLSARKEFSFSPGKPYEVIFSAEVNRGGTALASDDCLGPRTRHRPRLERDDLLAVAAAALLPQWQGQPRRVRRHRRSTRRSRAASASAASTITTSSPRSSRRGSRCV